MRKIVEWDLKCFLVQCFFPIIILFCLLSGIALAKRQEKERQHLLMENTLLKEIILRQYEHCYKISDLKLFDSKQELYLSDVLDDEYSLLIWFSELHCSSCIEFVLNELNFFENEGFDDRKIVIIGSFRNKRSYLQFVQNHKIFFQFFGEMETLLNGEYKEDMPSMFLLNKDRDMKCLFYPLKEIPSMMHNYIEIINKQL